MCYRVSHTKPFRPYILTYRCPLQRDLQSLVSGFWYTINIRSSLGLLSDVLLLPCVMEVLQLWNSKTSFHFFPVLHKWYRFWGGPPQSPGFGPGQWQSWSVCEHCLICTPRAASSPALPSPHTLGTSSPEQKPPDQMKQCYNGNTRKGLVVVGA